MSKKKKSKRTNIAEQFLSDLVMEPVELPSFLSDYISAQNEKDLSESKSSPNLDEAKTEESFPPPVEQKVISETDDVILTTANATTDVPAQVPEPIAEIATEPASIEVSHQITVKDTSDDDSLADKLKPAVKFEKRPSSYHKAVKQKTLDESKSLSFFKYPHELMEFVVNSDLSKNDRRVYDCLLRNTLGRWKDTCEAGYTFIGNYTGIKYKHVIARAIERLVNSGLVVVVGEPDYGKGTTYFVPKAKEYLTNAGEKPGVSIGGSNQIVNSEQNVDGNQIVNSGVNNLDTGGVNNLDTNKESPKEIKKKSLSTEKMWITDFLKAKIPNEGRRERGERVFMGLVDRGLKKEDIIRAYEWVEKNGMVGSGGSVGDIAKYVEAFHDRILDSVRRAEVRSASSENAVAKMEADREKQNLEDQREYEAAVMAVNEIASEEELKSKFISDLREKYVESMRANPFKKEYVEIASSLPDKSILLMWHRGELN